MRTKRDGRLALAIVAAVAVPACASAVSTQREVAMGMQASEEIEQELPILDDAEITTYVTELGRRLVGAAGSSRDVPWQFRVVDTDQINAFALPGGFIYVTRGLIEEADTMSELAGPLAHEIAHVEHRHGVEQMSRMQSTALGATLAYVLLGREPGDLEQAALGVGAGAVFASYSRDDEREADASAIEYTTSAGIDPSGLTRFFATLAAEEEERGVLERWFATHPMTEDRLEATEAAIAAKPTAELQVDDPAFQRIKARLESLPPPPAETAGGEDTQ
ncbi:M48 family metallopeptidase [Sandaracinus amylolyticus]|uniref:Peptidase M48 domain-containing protein n=1 Tax=Sandaracinus amylolyticus TaxID=927083 RepID=A0A0F6YGJ3_9BACT|nr:M48 family metallopeptidase [Sandaracinus amylolyticus]AKF02926.1 hypothetical protein DB32_000074 [Sandaracinus amylolyticus]